MPFTHEKPRIASPQSRILKIGAICLIAAGVCLLAWPVISRLATEAEQQRIIAEWRESLLLIDSSPAPESGTPAAPPASALDGSSPESAESSESSDAAKAAARQKYIGENMVGLITIEKIGLSGPILKGTTDYNLGIAMTTIEPTGRAGQPGNFAVAGHRNRGYGRDFNRLDEVAEGDVVQVDDGSHLYSYTVTEKLYVLPEEVWVLEDSGDDATITLVTCHPPLNATHRLIIRGKLNAE